MGQVNELKDFTRGQLDAALMKIGQDAGMGTADGIRAFLSGEVSVSGSVRRWVELDNVIYFPLPPTDGTTGPLWIPRLEKKGFRIGEPYAKSVLCSDGFKPTKGVINVIAVLKGTLFEDSKRITKNIRAEAYAGAFTQGKKLFDPNAEVACIIRENFSDKEIEAMGLWWIIAMHEPINDSDGDPDLLGAGRIDDGRWLRACYGRPDVGWDREFGFAFAASQVVL